MFKVEFPLGHGENYSEVSQRNPLRWMMLKPGKKKGEFIQDSYWLKCKDFFNDYVYARMKCGAPFQIYGFNTTAMALGTPTDPVFVLLKKYGTAFLDNMKVVNEWLKTNQGLSTIKLVEQDNYVLVEFPPEYWMSTYNVSLISLIMRVVSGNTKLATFDDICKFVPPGENHLWPPVVKKGKFFKIPDKFKDYVWYQDENNNSKKTKASYGNCYMVHDCGVIAWQENFK